MQGVGFRYTAKTVATGFEVTGTVRNLPDGRVEVIAEGARDGTGSLSHSHSRRGTFRIYTRRKRLVE